MKDAATPPASSRGRWCLVVGGVWHDLPDAGAVELARAGRERYTTAGRLLLVDPTGTMSKLHARLRRDGETWFVTDLHSRNGTALRDPKGRRTALKPGSEARVEGTLLLGQLEAELRVTPGGEI